MNAIVRWYAKRILRREIQIDDIPEMWRQSVIDYLAGEVNER